MPQSLPTLDPKDGYSVSSSAQAPSGNTSTTPSTLDPSQGYSLGGGSNAPASAGAPTNGSSQDIGPSPGQAIFDTVKGVGTGMGKALESTIEGGGHMIRSALGMQQPNDLNRPELKPQGFNEQAGYGGETLLEFLAGEGAADVVGKGALSLADKWSQAAKVAKVLESSPKLMTAVKIGANALKAGAVQGGQTLARTGGDVKEAAKAGGEMGAIAVPLGAVGAGVEALGRGLSKGAEASGRLTEAAGKFGDTSSTADLAQDYVEKSKQELHQNYENTINNLKDRAGDTTIDPVKEGNSKPAIALKAEELLKNPVPADHPLVSEAKGMTGEKLDGSVKNILKRMATGYESPEDFDAWNKQQELIKSGKLVEKDGQVYKANELKKFTDSQQPNAEGEASGVKAEAPKGEALIPEPKKLPEYDLEQLINLRQELRQAASQNYEPGNINARTLNASLKGIDDTIAQLAEKAPDASLPADYDALRADYRSKINVYNTPVVKNIRAGNYDDATKALLSGNTAGAKTEQLRTILGDDRMDDFAHHAFTNMLQSATDKSGQVNAARLIGMWNKVPAEAKENLFAPSTAGKDISGLMKDASIARNIQYLTRVGVLAPAIAAGGQATHLGLIGLLLAEGAAGGSAAIPKVREFLDYAANHPKMWKAIGGAGEALQGTGATVGGQAVTGAVGQAVSGANKPYSFGPENPDSVKRTVYGSATGLAGKQ